MVFKSLWQLFIFQIIAFIVFHIAQEEFMETRPVKQEGPTETGK